MSDASMSAKPHYLVGDIGGTNARFAYVTPESEQPLPVAKYRVAEFKNFDEVMNQLIADWRELGLPEDGPEKTCLAVAAPPHLSTISFTNSPWRFDRALLGRHLKNSSIDIINDFAAVARALPALSADDVEQIGAGVIEAGKPMVSIGPGTGTGVATVIFDHSGAPVVLQGEGGHVDFAPITDMEFEVLKRLRARYGRVSIERLLCGAGIVNIYQAIAEIRGVQAELSTPADIGAAAQHEAPLASEAMAMFFAVLGSSAGNLALTTGALGGVFIAGGIAPRYIDLLRRSDFRARFLAKGRFADYNTNIGTFVITHDDPGLVGAALCLGDTL
jgi:glucokinase